MVDIKVKCMFCGESCEIHVLTTLDGCKDCDHVVCDSCDFSVRKDVMESYICKQIGKQNAK